MFQRVNYLPIELPEVQSGDLISASIVQELIKGKSGEINKLNTYMFQAMNFREKMKLKPFYDLLASITAEQLGLVELMVSAFNLLNVGTSFREETEFSQLQHENEKNPTKKLYLYNDSVGNPLSGELVYSTGNLTLDLQHVFFLANSSHKEKMMAYERATHPVFREVIGYLLVREGAHIMAFAKAIEMATGVNVAKMLPIPITEHHVFEAARKYEERGDGHVLYTWNYVGDYRDIDKIWKGLHPETGQPLVVLEGIPEERGKVPNMKELQDEYSPGISADEYQNILKRLLSKG
ncbi:Mn-containing catalase [Lysinibacillus composti]|uniref:Manganese catalase family protein n=1 Tax=Lysinibacillus composti TaxID=720633 RepID=A0A3N9UKQ8_9BACI|nr:manganese catalase family protein [Lysinibacillus composti]MBM7606974.1 Mn-containing catalase [Lysinibacillus composti]RQW76425.1 manganese catalase family protein [Lysinibacillus composti]